MEYKGEVYARIGGKYIACTETVADLENKIKELESQLEAEKQVKNNLVLADVSGSVAYPKVSKLLAALNDIRNWDDDLEDEWEDAGYRAKAALAEYYKATDR
jgi:hypothetical protein